MIIWRHFNRKKSLEFRTTIEYNGFQRQWACSGSAVPRGFPFSRLRLPLKLSKAYGNATENVKSACRKFQGSTITESCFSNNNRTSSIPYRSECPLLVFIPRVSISHQDSRQQVPTQKTWILQDYLPKTSNRIIVGRGGSLVDSSPFFQRVAGSNPVLAAT